MAKTTATLITILGDNASIMASLPLANYNGRTIQKRDSKTKEIVDKVMQFNSGKHGYYAGGKLVLDGKNYQVSCSIVEITGQVSSPVTSFTPEQIAQMNAQAQAHAAENGDGDDDDDDRAANANVVS